MKLKLVVATMGVLGLVSYPAFADTQSQHKTKRHHMVAQNYKGEDYKAVVDVCPVEMYAPTMDAINQNIGRAKPTVDCNKPISLSGGVNFDAHFGNLSQGYMGENNERFSLNDAYLNVHGRVNDWTKAFVSLSYNNVSTASAAGVLSNATNGSTNGMRQFVLTGSQYSFVYPVNTLTVQEGYIQFSNFDMSPVFVQLGKKFTNYNRYEIHPITRTMTQVLTESLRTQAQIGFIVPMGISGSLYAYDTPLKKVSESHSTYTYGAALGWDVPSDQLGWDLGIGWVSNMLGANDVAGAVNAYRTATGAVTGNYVNTVSAVALYGDVNSGPFSLGARYTTALQNFNPADAATTVAGTSGAKPWAFDIKAGYGFDAWSKNQNVYLGYQTSGSAVTMALPSSRWTLGWGVDMYKSTLLALEFNHDNAYSAGSGGTGNSSNTVAFRAGVKFG